MSGQKFIFASPRVTKKKHLSMASTSAVPVIDFKGFLADDSTLDRRRQIGQEVGVVIKKQDTLDDINARVLFDQLVRAYKDIGFAYIKNYGIDPGVVKEIFDQVRFRKCLCYDTC